MKIFTFWEPKDKIPAYLQLCMKTWEKYIDDAEIIILDYSNLSEYVDMSEYLDELTDGRFSLPQIADAVRIAVLNQHGGLWLDCDTIVLSKKFENRIMSDKETVLIGNPERRKVSIGVIKSVSNSKMLIDWVDYQKYVIKNFNRTQENFWSYLGNSFTDPYLESHFSDVEIKPIGSFWPELYVRGLSDEANSHPEKYREFYFEKSFNLCDLKETEMLMLHNSWTPPRFKEMTEEEFLKQDCTISNILCEALDYNIKNRYILHKLDGTVQYNPVIKGLSVDFKGLGASVELYEPIGKFEDSSITAGEGALVSIQGSDVLPVRHGLHINAGAKGSRCCIGKNFSCWNVYFTLIDETNLGILVGDDVMVSSGVEFRPSDAHSIFEISTNKLINRGSDIVIGNHVWIGKNVLVGKGVKISSNSVVAAYSKVTNRFDDENIIVGGIPAKILKTGINWSRVHPDCYENLK